MQNKSNESNNIEITFWPQRILLTRLRLRVVGLVSIWTETGRAAVYATYRSILVRPIDMSMTPAIATAVLRGDAYSPYFRLISCRSPQKRKDSHLLTPAISAASIQLIFFAIAFNNTSCSFIVRSITAALIDLGFVNFQDRRRSAKRTSHIFTRPDISHTNDIQSIGDWPPRTLIVAHEARPEPSEAQLLFKQRACTLGNDHRAHLFRHSR